MCSSSGRDADALGHQAGEHLGGERASGARHLGRTRLGGVDVLVGRDRVAAAARSRSGWDGRGGPGSCAGVRASRRWRPRAARRPRRDRGSRAPAGRRGPRRRSSMVLAGVGAEVRPARPGGPRRSTARPAAGSRGGPGRAEPSGAVPSSSAARVPDVLMTTRSPSSRKRGSSEKCECTSEPSDLVATSMRTASRVMPRYSGGAGASSSGGRAKRERVQLGQAGRRRASRARSPPARSCHRSRRDAARRPGSARSGGRCR